MIAEEALCRPLVLALRLGIIDKGHWVRVRRVVAGSRLDHILSDHRIPIRVTSTPSAASCLIAGFGKELCAGFRCPGRARESPAKVTGYGCEGSWPVPGSPLCPSDHRDPVRVMPAPSAARRVGSARVRLARRLASEAQRVDRWVRRAPVGPGSAIGTAPGDHH